MNGVHSNSYTSFAEGRSEGDMWIASSSVRS